MDLANVIVETLVSGCLNRFPGGESHFPNTLHDSEMFEVAVKFGCQKVIDLALHSFSVRFDPLDLGLLEFNVRECVTVTVLLGRAAFSTPAS